MARKASEDGGSIAGKAHEHEPRMGERLLHHGGERTELKPIAAPQGRRQRPVFGAHAMVAGAERQRDEAMGITRHYPAGEADLDPTGRRSVPLVPPGSGNGAAVGQPSRPTASILRW